MGSLALYVKAARHDGSACLTSTNYDSRSDLDKNNVSTRAALLYLSDKWRRPYLSYSTAFTPTSFADENGNVLEPMKGKQWEAG